MTHTRLVLAILISVGLIGGSLLHRTLGIGNPDANLYVAADSSNQGTLYETVEIPFIQGAPAGSLTDTDLIGRQFFSEYLDLAMSGNATPEKIEMLVANYADIIARFDKFTPITTASIKIVPDSQESYQNYGNTTLYIRNKYKRIIQSQVDEYKINAITDPAFATFAKQSRSIFIQAADELKKVSVPASQAKLHTELINNYLSSASALNQNWNSEEDAVGIYAALSLLVKNSAREQEIYLATLEALMNRNVRYVGEFTKAI
ncbi:MAG: hypothetical protein WD874_00975 [Parcubacteria group bacterium]